MSIRVVYNHSLRGSSFGRKAEFLKYLSHKKNYTFSSIEYNNMYDMQKRSDKLIETCKNFPKDDFLFIGTGAGAYVSLISSKILESRIRGMILISPIIDIERDSTTSLEILNLRNYSLVGSNYRQKYPVPYMKKEMNLAVIHGMKDEVVPYPIVEGFTRKYNGMIFPIDEGKHNLRCIFPILEETFGRVSSNI